MELLIRWSKVAAVESLFDSNFDSDWRFQNYVSLRIINQ